MEKAEIRYMDFDVTQSVVDWTLIEILKSIEDKEDTILASKLLEYQIRTKYIIQEGYNFHTKHIVPILYEKTADVLDGFIPKNIINKYLVMDYTEARKNANITFTELVVPVFKSPSATLVDKLLSVMFLWKILKVDVDYISSDYLKTRIELDAIRYEGSRAAILKYNNVFMVDPLMFDKYLTGVFNKIVSIYYLEENDIEDGISYLINTMVWIINTYHKLSRV